MRTFTYRNIIDAVTNYYKMNPGYSSYAQVIEKGSNNPLKILLLSHLFYPSIGGIEVNSQIYAHSFLEAGHEVRIVTWSDNDRADYFPFVVVRNPSYLTLIKEHSWADVVFENNPCVRLAWPGLLFRRACVIALNTELYHADSRVGWLKKFWLKRASAVIAVSDSLRTQFWPAASVIGNPYRSNEFRILPEIVRTDDFVFLGRLVSQKGANQAVLAFHQLLALLRQEAVLAKTPSLTIIGDGPERANLEQLVTSLGLDEHVHFTGFLQGEALVQQLNRHRFIVVPSLYGEAFGNVVLEGMACGCMPIVSDSDGLPSAVGKAGLIFKRGNVEALTASIWHILHSPELELQLRQAATTHLEEHRPEVISQRYLRVLEAVAG